MNYRLVTTVKGNKITKVYRGFSLATTQLLKYGHGRLYQGKKLVGEL